jgi:methanogenic corrinoid protein MtbC1
VIETLKQHDATSLQNLLVQLVMKQGLQRFVLDTVTPLNRAVGDAWMRGDLQVFEEHFYTEQVNVALRTAINAFPRAPVGEPRVLLTTFPSEQHGVGLLMVEAMLVPEGVQCVSLGTQTPLEDIRRATVAHKAHILALSFSGSFPLRVAAEGLDMLRGALPPHVTVWAGGEMTRRIRKTIPGVVLIPDLASLIGALRSWRTHFAPHRAA